MDPETGIIREPGHELHGQSVAGKNLVFPAGKGSTTGSWQDCAAFKGGSAPHRGSCVCQRDVGEDLPASGGDPHAGRRSRFGGGLSRHSFSDGGWCGEGEIKASLYPIRLFLLVSQEFG